MMRKQAKIFAGDTTLVTTLLIIWLLDKPLASVVNQLKITQSDLIKGIHYPANPLKRFLLLYMRILRKSSGALELKEQFDELKSLIAEAKNLNVELEKRDIYLPLPLDLTYLERLIDVE